LGRQKDPKIKHHIQIKKINLKTGKEDKRKEKRKPGGYLLKIPEYTQVTQTKLKTIHKRGL